MAATAPAPVRAPRLLLVEDDAAFADRMKRHLAQEQVDAEVARDGRAALDRLRQQSFDLVVCDVRLPVVSGLDVLRTLRAGAERDLDRDTPVVMLSSVTDVAVAVECMRLGAMDYLTKDADKAEIVVRVRRALESGRLRVENRLLRDQLDRKSRTDMGLLVGDGAAMRRLRSELEQVAPSFAPVLLLGETGVGKELAARALHKLGPTPGGPFVDVNCGALPDENLFHSEVFGHEAGAFTGAAGQRRGCFEQAHQGTLFLDEVGELSLAAQAKILKAIETQQFTRLGGNKMIHVSCRLILATHRDLPALVRDGKFREDLYYRVSVVPVHLPALRERREDIPKLAAYFLDRFAAQYNRPAPKLDAASEVALMGAPWPGNVREFRNIMERLALRIRSETITLSDLATVGVAVDDARPTASIPVAASHRDETFPSPEFDPRFERLPADGVLLEDVEQRLVEAALRQADWNQKQAAKLLGISHDRLNARVKKFGIRHPSWRKNR